MSLIKNIFILLFSSPAGVLSTSKKLSDEELIHQIVATNNTLLFSTLYDRYSKKVYNKCYSFARNEDEAEDLTQDVFLKLFTKLNTFQNKAKFSTWLYAFTYNFCANYISRDKGHKLQKESDAMDNHEYYLSHMEDINEEDLFDLKVSNLEKALNNIDPQDKAILLLKYQDDSSIQEIQTVLKIGESAVKMRLKRARIRVVEEHNKLE